jgi:hypothetical protein
MSHSQITMAALRPDEHGNDGKRLAICGDLTGEEGKMLESAEIFFVVHQASDTAVAQVGKGCCDRAGRRREGQSYRLHDAHLDAGHHDQG